jgi:MscS family membrane protein
MGRDRPIRLAAVLFLALAVPRAGRSQVPGVGASPAPSLKPADRDPLGRDTPYGCVVGFLRSAERGEYSRAAEYLDMKPSAAARERARQLRTILDAGLVDLETISKTPDGDRNDGLPANRERVGIIQTDGAKLEILLDRVLKGGSSAVWLFAHETLLGAPTVFDQIDDSSIEKLVPRPLREIRIFSLPLYRWLGTLLGVLAAVGLAWLGARALFPLVGPLIRRITQEQDDRRLLKLRLPFRLILLSVGFRILAMLSLTVLGRQFWISLAIGIAIFGTAWLVIRISDIVMELTRLRLTRGQLESKRAVLALSHRAFKIAVALAAAVAMVYASGRDVTAILAGVGLGGIAVAFAAQKTLENLFGGVAIISDEPIRVGDFCRFADKLGTVEDIGLRSTRVRTLDCTLLSIPNGQLSVMTLENFTLRDRFLFNHKIALRYETTPAQLRQILADLRDLFRTHPSTDPEVARIRLVQFGDSAFLIEVFVYLLGSDYLVFLETQEELLLSIMDIIVAGGSGFAYPSHTLYLAQDKPQHAIP